MKFRTRTEKFTEPITIDGKTHNVQRTREFRVPNIPRDWDATLDRLLSIGTGAVVVGALAWSVVSIGSLLSALAPVWLAFVIASVFDLAWVLAMGMERQLRFEPAKQRVPKIAGWVLLAVSVSVIFLHGLRVADIWVALAGSVIAVLAKSLWAMRMWSTTRKLGETAQAWLVAELDEVEATLAVTTARRRIARVRARADDELRALGAEQPTEHTVERGYPVDVHPIRPDIHPEPTPDAVSAPPQARGASAPDIHPSVPGLQRIPTDIHPVSTADGVATLVGLIRAGNTPTISEVQEMFGKPYTTAQRWLAKAKDQANENTGQYL